MTNSRSAWRQQLDRIPFQAHWRQVIDRLAQFRARIDEAERRRLLTHAFGLTSVLAATIAHWSILGRESVAPFWLFQTAVALTALYGGLAAATVATLASLLAARMLSGVALSSGILFSIDVLLVSLVIVRLRDWLAAERRRTNDGQRMILRMRENERQAALVDSAFSRLEEVSTDAVVIMLDRDGRIADWRAGATRLYQSTAAEAVGRSASTLFGPDFSPDDYVRLMGDARCGEARHIGQHRRADGSLFTVELEIKPLSPGDFDGFTMLVSDLSRQEAWDAFTTSATEAHARLRTEADVAQRQLATLQNLTDPSLNLLDSAAQVRALLNRLRGAIDAEGIAVVQTGGFERRVFSSSGLQCRRGSQRPPATGRVEEPVRALIIHNDPASVAETSAVEWPAGVSSLISVPVICAGSRQAVIEVVSARRRRATEWEIALIQVVSARIAGLLRDDFYAGAGAA